MIDNYPFETYRTDVLIIRTFVVLFVLHMAMTAWLFSQVRSLKEETHVLKQNQIIINAMPSSAVEP